MTQAKMTDGSSYPIPARGGYSDGSGSAWRGRDGRAHAMAGSNSRTSTLSEPLAQAILDAPVKGESGYLSNTKLAALFGPPVTHSQVGAIRTRRNWTHIRRRAASAEQTEQTARALSRESRPAAG